MSIGPTVARLGVTTTLFVLLGACASTAQRSLHVGEDLLDTGGPITVQYHSALYYPEQIALRHDGYLVGIEKSPREFIDPTDGLKIKDINDAGLNDGKAQKFLNDRRQMFVSHVIATDARGGDATSEILFSSYRTKRVCLRGAVCSSAPPTAQDVATARVDSWEALDVLRQSLEERAPAGNYTHLLVVAMGWNTVQEEAVRNVNSIATQVKAAAGRGFRPLLIAVTWPSEWNNKWADPVFKLFSFPIKAHDADEVGLTWLGVLLHETLPDARTNLPVVAVGHSFGSRAMSTASCVGPIIYRDDPHRGRARIDTLINLEGAFQARRLFGEVENGLRYPTHCTNVDVNVLTASANDKAVSKTFWGPITGYYAGDIKSWNDECRALSNLNCGRVDESGHIQGLTQTGAKCGIIYLNVDELIRENAYLTGGGAHSDIYRRPHGVLLDNVIRRSFAPSFPP